MTVVQILGPSSSGKTTLINHVKENIDYYEKLSGKSIRIEDEYSRRVFSSEYSRDYDTFEDLISDPVRNYDFQKYVNGIVTRHESKYIDEPDTILLCDGGSISNLVYLSLAYKHLPTKKLRVSSKKLYDKAKSNTEGLFSLCDSLYLSTPNQPSVVEHDGFRPETLLNYRNEELDLFTNYKYDCTHLFQKSLKSRFDSLDKYFISMKEVI